MKLSDWKAPEPTTVSSAILFHCATVFPGGSAAAALRVAPAETATARATTAIATIRRTRARTRILITPPFSPNSWWLVHGNSFLFLSPPSHLSQGAEVAERVEARAAGRTSQKPEPIRLERVRSDYPRLLVDPLGPVGAIENPGGPARRHVDDIGAPSSPIGVGDLRPVGRPPGSQGATSREAGCGGGG